ncbi:MAG: hypothetical protein JWQ34_2126 [Mucilaginibacter sp.]|uniref:hypothetical protein n=1 Tax=Mucilaginibacter sp. TaxID=1882438 RepID=UPI0026171C00|nr:hypothetical protein [Mucilaginibacter sp.]MDB5003901.1 hypothetical protein [Mucilaginibacter sp.]
MKKETTIPGVFIIESLTFEDEKDQLFEGEILSNILHLNGVESQYYYIRTKKELLSVLTLFYNSNFRYLHISCHGGNEKIYFTLDEITYNEFGEILENHLYKKRLFLSACSSVNINLASAVIPISKCYSVIGPVNSIEFRDAAIIWASFYHLMFKTNENNMLRDGLIENLQKIVNAFEQPLNYFSISKSKGITKKKITSQKTEVPIID